MGTGTFRYCEDVADHLVQKRVKVFAKVPYLQHYYDTECLDEESQGIDRVAEHGS